MIINHASLATLFTAFKAAFQGGLDQAASVYTQVATVVPSTTGTEEYGWLGRMPNMREWVGSRVVHGLQSHGYSVKNKPFELTVGVPRSAIEDDQYGVYTPLMTELGRAAGAHPDQLVFGALSNGHTNLCYDGQNFFDTDHPVIDANGAIITQSNLEDNSNSGTRWYLIDASRALKPIIFQDRKRATFVAKTAETDDNVFSAGEYVYGVDSRCNVGYGFWQLAYCSRKSLDETNFTDAFTAMTARLGDHGRPLGIRPTHLVVPPSKEIDAEKLINAIYNANGASNVLAGKVQVVVAPWLT